MTDTLEDRLRADLARRADGFTTSGPKFFHVTSSETPRPRRYPRRKLISAGFIVGALAIGAVPAAAAAGLAPGIASAFGWTHQQPSAGGLPLIQANDASGHLVLSLPGANGFAPITIYAATNNAGGHCYTVVSEQAGQRQNLGSCFASSDPRTLTDGGGGGSSTGYLETIRAPGAAYITVGGSSSHVPVAEGITAIWLGPDELNHQVSVASFSSSGARLQSIAIDEHTTTSTTPWPGPGPAPIVGSEPNP